jgi:ElaB/YqjD/DUF883 family membrane-anchored ribosome-binding protein
MSHTEESTAPSSALQDGVESAQARAAEVAGQAQEAAQRAASQYQDRLRDQLDRRSSQAAAQIGEQASDLRSVGESLREQGKDGPAKAADQLAQYAEKVGGYLREKDSRALLADAEDFGRRQPWAVAAGGLALGFAASRFLKASSGQRYRTLTESPPAGAGRAAVAPPSNGMGDWAPSAGVGPVM